MGHRLGVTAPIPDFLHDLDAMYTAEEYIPHDLRTEYVRVLYDVGSQEESAVQDLFRGIRRTAAERAEASVLVMTKPQGKTP